MDKVERLGSNFSDPKTSTSFFFVGQLFNPPLSFSRLPLEGLKTRTGMHDMYWFWPSRGEGRRRFGCKPMDLLVAGSVLSFDYTCLKKLWFVDVWDLGLDLRSTINGIAK